MNIHRRWLCTVISGLVIFIVSLVELAGENAEPAQLLTELRGGGALPLERLILSGVTTAGKYQLASLRDAKTGMAAWYTVGEVAFGYKLKRIADNHVVLVRRGSDEELQVSLSGIASSADAGPEPFSRAWINSRSNPMLWGMKELPGMHHNWPEFTDGEKLQIIDFFRKHGWKLERVVSLGDTAEFVWRNIYEAERTAAIKANREKFDRTLTPDQRVLWKEMSSFQKIYPAEPGKLSDEQKAFIAARQRVIDEFKASFTPEQKAEHAAIMDFTKANWK